MPKTPPDPTQITSRKVKAPADPLPDSLQAWMESYQALAVAGVRSAAVAQKIGLHLERFQAFFQESYGHDRISACLRRDVLAWQARLQGQRLAPATVNNHLASLSAFTTWVQAQASRRFPAGDPAKGVGELALPPLEPRALSATQVRSLKNLCDRLPRLHQLRGRRWHEEEEAPPVRAHTRPWRDRAIVFVLLSTGLRREELVRLDLEQLEPCTPAGLRAARKARITRVQGKGRTERTVFLSADARAALADYLERERPDDAGPAATALFLSAHCLPARAADGRLSPRAVNLILEGIGRRHDAEIRDPERQLAPLRPHDLRHTFAFQLAAETGKDAYELERRLGHRSQRYIQRYTNPPEAVAAGYVESF
jgi:integrase